MRGMIDNAHERVFDAVMRNTETGEMRPVRIVTGTAKSKPGEFWARVEGEHTYTTETAATEGEAISAALAMFWPEDDAR